MIQPRGIIHPTLTVANAVASIEVLAELVAAMRIEQRAYFKTRDREHLMDSKTLESRVDAAVAAILADEQKQEAPF